MLEDEQSNTQKDKSDDNIIFEKVLFKTAFFPVLYITLTPMSFTGVQSKHNLSAISFFVQSFFFVCDCQYSWVHMFF